MILVVDWPVGLVWLGASLVINAYWMLKVLELNITVTGDNHHPLCGLSHELRFITGNNILEELQLDVMVSNSSSYLTESEDWSAFNSVLAESTVFPMLFRLRFGGIQNAGI